MAFLFVLHRRSQLLPAKGKIVFVSGCDSGFGYMTALKLADMGALVVRLSVKRLTNRLLVAYRKKALPSSN